MWYAKLDEQGNVTKVDLKDEPVRVKNLPNGLPMLRLLIIQNPPCAPWQQYSDTPTYEVLNDSVIEHGVVIDKPLAAMKEAKVAAVEGLLQQKFEHGVEVPASNGKRLQIRSNDLVNINNMTLLPNGPGNWRMKDDSFMPVDNQQNMRNLAQFAAASVLSLRQVAWQHKDAVKALTTAKQVHEYDILQGW
jgi:hypothetical protein